MTTPDFSDIKAFIFDYGGTLDTNARHWSYVLWEGFCQTGMTVDEQAFREAYVYAERTLEREHIIEPEDDFHSLLLKKVDIETRRLCETGAYTAHESTRRQHCRAIADYCYQYARHIIDTNRPVLDILRETYPLVLVSNFYGNINTILKDFRIAYFHPVIESDVVGVRKPDPAIYRMGVEATGLPASQVLVVGDSYDKDILPARQAGCRTVWMKGEEWEQKSVDESVPDAIIPDLPSLLKLPGLDGNIRTSHGT